jgi:PAS domain S-box-containing protein
MTDSYSKEQNEIINSLKQDKYMLHSVLNSLQGHIVILSERGEISYTNQAWDDFALDNGLEPEKVSQGVNYLDVCKKAEKDNDLAGEAREGIRKVIKGEKSEFVLDYPCHSSDQLRWFEMKVTPFVGVGPFSVVIIHKNITDKKLAKIKRQSILDNLPFIVMRHEREDKISFVNQAIHRHLNIDPKKFMNNPDQCGVQKQMIKKWRKNINKVFRTGEVVEFEITGNTTGNTQYYQCKIIPEYVNSEVKSVLSMVHDITEIKQTKIELKKQKKYYQQLFDNSPEAIALLDNDDQIIKINYGFENLFNYEISEVKDKNINEVIVPDKHFQESESLSREVYEGKEIKVEATRINSNNEFIEVEITAFPVVLEGSRLGIFVIYRDIGDKNND